MATLTELSFGKRIEPEEITPQVREDLARAEWWDEWTWIGLIAVFAVAVAMAVSLAYRWHAEARFAELPPIGIVAIVGLIALLVAHLWFERRRNFIRRMPATMGLVLKAEETYKYSDDGASHLKTLTLRYVPCVPATEDVKVALLLGEGAMRLQTQLGPHAREFAETITEGALVTLLYDPDHPNKVRVVDRTVREHAHRHATAA